MKIVMRATENGEGNTIFPCVWNNLVHSARAGRSMVCLVELFWADDGQTIPPHHSIAKYLKNLKLMLRTGTYLYSGTLC